MRKIMFSGTVISALFGGISTIKATRSGPHDWRLILMWISWGLTVAIAVGTVIQDSEHAPLDQLED